MVSATKWNVFFMSSQSIQNKIKTSYHTKDFTDVTKDVTQILSGWQHFKFKIPLAIKLLPKKKTYRKHLSDVEKPPDQSRC